MAKRKNNVNLDALIILILLGYNLSIDFKNNKFEIVRMEQVVPKIEEGKKDNNNKEKESENINNGNDTVKNNEEIGTTKQDYDNGKKF